MGCEIISSLRDLVCLWLCAYNLFIPSGLAICNPEGMEYFQNEDFGLFQP